MAEKLIFLTSERKAFEERAITYEYFPGFAVSQKQKCIASLHKEIKRKYPDKKVLEISTKSMDPVGVKLSAFNLKFWHEELQEYRNIENVFQSSKVFEGGGPYRDLLDVHPRTAKRDERLISSGKLKCFELYGTVWDLEPKTMFYDWLYINALMKAPELCEAMLEYDIFTDIEFNSNRSINCQARSAAIYVSLVRNGKLEQALSDKEEFRRIYQTSARR